MNHWICEHTFAFQKKKKTTSKAFRSKDKAQIEGPNVFSFEFQSPVNSRPNYWNIFICALVAFLLSWSLIHLSTLKNKYVVVVDDDILLAKWVAENLAFIALRFWRLLFVLELYTSGPVFNEDVLVFVIVGLTFPH